MCAILHSIRCQYNSSIRLLRGIIKTLHWPPTAEDLSIRSHLLPDELQTFLTVVLAGKPEVTCEKTNRLVLSTGQDICRSVTDGEWKLPKHILLCTPIRHLYRSKKLTNIIHRLGHCESYDFGLDLETNVSRNHTWLRCNLRYHCHYMTAPK